MGYSKAYYLKNLELAVLLAVKGMDQLFGIRMKGLKNPEKSEVYRTLFALEKKGMLSVQGKRTVIGAELNRMLDMIRSAGMMFCYTSRKSEHPDLCVYLSEEAVLLSGCGRSGEMNRMESVSLEFLPEKISECGFFLEEPEQQESPYREEKAEMPAFAAQADALFGKEIGAMKEEDWGNAQECLRIFSLRSMKCVKQYVLIRDRLYDYIGQTDETGTDIYRYSERKMAELLKGDICQKGGKIV